MKKYFTILIWILVVSCTSKNEIGEKRDPIHISVVPGKDGDLIRNWIGNVLCRGA